MQGDQLISFLDSRLPGIGYSVNANDLIQFGQDWTRFYTPDPAVVFFPKSTADVQGIVKVAAEIGQVVVPSGGRTGYSAGAVAADKEWVISLAAMREIGDYNPIEQTVKVEAGVITAELQHFAEQHDLFYPVDFASSGSSQIGGNIATNAGGIRVLRYGLTRDYVQSLTVVTGEGEVLHLNNGLIKNAAGPDFRHLMIGSEGILGVITEAEMRLLPQPPNQSVMLLALTDLDAVMQVFAMARKHLTLSSFEFFSHQALQRVTSHRELNQPFTEAHSHYVLMEFDDDETAVMALFEKGMEQDIISDGVLAQSMDQAQQLWQYREGISESIAHLTPYKNDISVRISKVTEFMQKLDDILAKHYPDFEIIWFGHIGDGNLHLNILKPEPLSTEEFKQRCEQVNVHVYGLIEALEGSISAEHGVGMLKKPFLHHSRNQADLALLKAMKKAFDPHNILNRGKVI
ncbi:FAD-binding oxidoreductase [Marinicella sp. W31]|uniref:FAD-binding oxidoreductase n=1 Tax=Marinicella sp. W31 TaxID=3023713 RepID=UPI003756CDE0